MICFNVDKVKIHVWLNTKKKRKKRSFRFKLTRSNQVIVKIMQEYKGMYKNKISYYLYDTIIKVIGTKL